MEIPTPISDAARRPHREYGLPDQVNYSVSAELERKLTVARRGLEKLACLGNGDRRGTSYGNSVAIDALKRIDETL